MGLWYSISGILLLVFLVVIGIEGIGLYSFFTIFIPYAAVLLFVVGFIYRVLKWASSPVPFHIPTVCGQQKSLPWIKPDKIDSPYTTGGVVKRLALDIFLFRSLLKNEKVDLEAPHRLLFRTSTLLWLGALAFHWSFLIIILRHLRFFLEPVPIVLIVLQRLDSILQNLMPIIYISDVVILIALAYLFLRRVIYPQVRYISLPSDYFVLLAIVGCLFLVLITWHVAFIPADINEPIVQVQNSEDLREVMLLIDASDQVVVASSNYWPLPWYYRGDRWNKIKFYGDSTDEGTLTRDDPGVIILHDAASYPSIQGYDKKTYKLGYWFSFYDNENRLIDYYLRRDGRMGSINIDVFTLQRGS